MENENRDKKWEKPKLTLIAAAAVSETVLSFSEEPPPPPGYPGGPQQP